MEISIRDSSLKTATYSGMATVAISAFAASYSSLKSAPLLSVTRTIDVGRLVRLAAPSSSFDGTYTYGIDASSHRIGTCAITSIGEMSPAMKQRPFSCGEEEGGGGRGGGEGGG